MTLKREETMEIQQLRDENIQPDTEVIAAALGPALEAYEQFMARIGAEPFTLQPEWRYYQDGKAWLCKLTGKKKTVFWLSVWQGFFKLSFYFSARHAPAVEALEVDRGIIERFRQRQAVGRLIPLVVNVHTLWQLDDLYRLIEFKKNLK